MGVVLDDGEGSDQASGEAYRVGVRGRCRIRRITA